MKRFKEFKEERLDEGVIEGILGLLAGIGIGLPLIELMLYMLDKKLDGARHKVWNAEWKETIEKYKGLLKTIQDYPAWKKLNSDPEFKKVLKNSVSGKQYKRGGRIAVEAEAKRILGDVEAEKFLRMIDKARDSIQKELK